MYIFSVMSGSRRCLLLLERCRDIKQLKQIHAQLLALGLGDDRFAVSRIMAFCCNPASGSASYAQLLFQHIQRPTPCIRNTMAKAFLLHGDYSKIIQVYRRMLHDGIIPDNYTLPYVLKACAGMQTSQLGSQAHVHVLKLGFGADEFVGNTTMYMYMAFGDGEAAQRVFDEMRQRTVVSWNIMISGYSKLGEVEAARGLFDETPNKDRGIWGSMIAGYVQNNCFKEGVLMFRLLQSESVEPDEGVLVSVLCACAHLGALDIGTWIHHYLNRMGFPLSVQLRTALIDMYLKCGMLDVAKKLFGEMPQRDTICWNVMILGLAMHGEGDVALELFRKMREEGFQPDDTTFLAVLTACSHSGIVEEGLEKFHSMRTVYHIEPKSEHYGCVADFLGRAGRFEEAKEIIERMPSSSCPSEKAIAWRALLSSCWNHGETELAEVAANHLLQLEDHSGVYVLLSNIYETSGKHESARKVKKCMKDRGVPKMPGCSSIELHGWVHEFVAGKQMHPNMEEIYSLLEKMNDHLSMADYRIY